MSPVKSEEISDWLEKPQALTCWKEYYSEALKASKWVGYPNTNYSWDGGRLSWEREITDEDGKKKTVKTYRDAIEIIADFKPESKVYGIDDVGGIERAAVKKFGGALKGFIWLDNVLGDGEVILPFVAPNIFVAIGERLKPNLIELSDDVHAENYYEVIEGKTHVHVKGFSGVGGAGKWAAGALIAQYKMNENTANDNDELVTNGTFAAWTNDSPDGWSVSGESGNDPVISEAATGEAHANTPTPGGGMCNIYTSDGSSVNINQGITLVIGKTYRLSINVDTVTAGIIALNITELGDKYVDSTGTSSWFFVATETTRTLFIERKFNAGLCDITFDNVSIKLCAAEDSSGNDHDMLMQQDTDAISVAGKINRAFDFNGSSDYGEIADDDDFTPALTLFSISIRVKMHNATNFVIASKGVEGTDGEWRFYTGSDDRLRFTIFDESASAYIGRKYNTTALTSYENQWIHLTATYDGGTSYSGIKLYLNGIQVDDASIGSGSFVAVENLPGTVHIGEYDGTFANGLFDLLQFFSVELTLRQVQRLYDFRVKESIFCPNPNRIYSNDMLKNAIYGGNIG